MWRCRFLKHNSECVHYRKSNKSKINSAQHTTTCQIAQNKARVFLFPLKHHFPLGSESPLKKEVKFGSCRDKVWAGWTEFLLSRQSVAVNWKGSNYRTSDASADNSPTHTQAETRRTHTRPVTSRHTRVQRVDITPPGARPGDNGLGKSNSQYVCPPTHKHTLQTQTHSSPLIAQDWVWTPTPSLSLACPQLQGPIRQPCPVGSGHK